MKPVHASVGAMSPRRLHRPAAACAVDRTAGLERARNPVGVAPVRRKALALGAAMLTAIGDYYGATGLQRSPWRTDSES